MRFRVEKGASPSIVASPVGSPRPETLAEDAPRGPSARAHGIVSHSGTSPHLVGPMSVLVIAIGMVVLAMGWLMRWRPLGWRWWIAFPLAFVAGFVGSTDDRAPPPRRVGARSLEPTFRDLACAQESIHEWRGVYTRHVDELVPLALPSGARVMILSATTRSYAIRVDSGTRSRGRASCGETNRYPAAFRTSTSSVPSPILRSRRAELPAGGEAHGAGAMAPRVGRGAACSDRLAVSSAGVIPGKHRARWGSSPSRARAPRG
jgi:hypothetical protein